MSFVVKTFGGKGGVEKWSKWLNPGQQENERRNPHIYLNPSFGPPESIAGYSFTYLPPPEGQLSKILARRVRGRRPFFRQRPLGRLFGTGVARSRGRGGSAGARERPVLKSYTCPRFGYLGNVCWSTLKLMPALWLSDGWHKNRLAVKIQSKTTTTTINYYVSVLLIPWYYVSVLCQVPGIQIGCFFTSQ